MIRLIVWPKDGVAETKPRPYNTDADDRVLARAEKILAKRAANRGDPLLNPGAVTDYLRVHMARKQHEAFIVLFLDTRHRPISLEEVFSGTLDGCAVHSREIVRRALQLNASAVILAHNHPSGNEEPSQADRSITQRLQDALGLIDVRVLDHFVFGDSVTSFAARGWI